MPVGASAAGAMPVAASALSATSAAPAATLSWDCGVVTTGARSRVDSCWVTSGMFAPPPTVATAETFASGMLLRCNVSSTVLSTPASGSAMSCSNSVRVTRTSEVNPGSSAGTDGRGLGGQPFLGLPAFVAQPGQRADRRGARWIGVVGLGDAGHDVVEQGLVDLVAGEVRVADRLADGVRSPSVRRRA